MRHNGFVSDADTQRIRERYPTRPGRRIFLIALTGVALALGTVWLVWAAWTSSHPAVSGQVSGFDVVSDTEITVHLIVERSDPSIAATCQVFVQSESFERVGELAVAVPPASDSQVRLDVPVKTFKRATSASLEACNPA